MLNRDAYIMTRNAISRRVSDCILREYSADHNEKPAETIPQIAWKMLQAGHSYNDVVKEVQRLNATSTRQFPLAELEKMAVRMGKL